LRRSVFPCLRVKHVSRNVMKLRPYSVRYIDHFGTLPISATCLPS
jgi:hypothetical protein